MERIRFFAREDTARLAAPDGSLIALTLTAGGTGYGSAPTVTIAPAPAGGTQATATATISPLATGQLSSLTVTNPGRWVTTVPIGNHHRRWRNRSYRNGAHCCSWRACDLGYSDQRRRCSVTPWLLAVSFSGGGSGADGNRNPGFHKILCCELDSLRFLLLTKRHNGHGCRTLRRRRQRFLRVYHVQERIWSWSPP